MKSKFKTYSYEELLQAKTELKKEIEAQELSVQNSFAFKLGSSIFSENKGLKNAIAAIPSLKIKNIFSSPIGNILSTVLLANKFTRKYFVAITMASQLYPLLIEKIEEMVQHKSNKS